MVVGDIIWYKTECYDGYCNVEEVKTRGRIIRIYKDYVELKIGAFRTVLIAKEDLIY